MTQPPDQTAHSPLPDDEFVLLKCSELDRLTSLNAELVAALEEMKEVAAAGMRVIDQAGLTDHFIAAVAAVGIKNGFGVRANAVLAKAKAQPLDHVTR
jgi:hypothetical protein